MTSPPNSRTHQLKNSSTHKIISTKTHQHKNSSVQKLINSLTQKLKLLSFILQCCSNFRSVLAKIQAEKSVKNRFLYPFAPLALSIFTPRSCILHHFAFLVWVKSDVFFRPKFLLLAPKTPLFNDYFALFRHVFHGSEGFCLYNCDVYLFFLSCV